MSTVTIPTPPKLEMPNKHYLNDNYGIRSWLLTKDHKRIAVLYLLSITFFFFIGGIFAALIRLHLLVPEGALFQADVYNKMFTMHGVNMVFFFLVPSIPATLGNFLVPLMVGAKDLALSNVALTGPEFTFTLPNVPGDPRQILLEKPGSPAGPSTPPSARDI